MKRDFNIWFKRIKEDKVDMLIRTVEDVLTLEQAEAKFQEWVDTKPYGEDATLEIFKVKSSIPRGERVSNVKGKEIKGRSI